MLTVFFLSTEAMLLIVDLRSFVNFIQKKKQTVYINKVLLKKK